MNEPNLVQYLVFIAIVTLCVKPLGQYMANVFERKRTILDPLLTPIEKLTFRVVGIDPDQGMGWKEYALAFVWLTMFGALFLYAVMRMQTLLPWFYPKFMNTPISADRP